MKCRYVITPGEEGFPKRPPKGALFVCTAEWSWSPRHDRCDAYWISRTRNKRWWLLWASWYEDSIGKDEYVIYYACEGTFKTKRQAAYSLLRDAWKVDAAEQNLDRPHDIDRIGVLSYEDIDNLMNEVWD